METKKISDLKRGEYFTKKPTPFPKEGQVWIRDEYDRASKKYICYKWSDTNDYQLIKGTQEVYTDFTF